MRHTELKIPQRVLGIFIHQQVQQRLLDQWQAYIKQKEQLTQQHLGQLAQKLIAFSREYLTHINKPVVTSGFKEEALFAKRRHDLDCVLQTLKVLQAESFINLSTLIDLRYSADEISQSRALSKEIFALQKKIAYDLRYCLLHENNFKISGALFSSENVNLAKMGLLLFGFLALKLPLDDLGFIACIIGYYFPRDTIANFDDDSIKAFNHLLTQVDVTIYTNQQQENHNCLLGFVVRDFTKLLLQSISAHKLDWQVIKNNPHRLKSLLTILVKKIYTEYIKRINDTPTLKLGELNNFFYWQEHIFINYIFTIVLKDNFPALCAKLVAWLNDLDETAKNILPEAYYVALDTLKQPHISQVNEYKSLLQIESILLYPVLFKITNDAQQGVRDETPILRSSL